MKQMMLLLLITVGLLSDAQDGKKGRVIRDHFLAASIQGNHAAENPVRNITIYLPPGYDNNKERYAVIYYLHGYTQTDSTCFEWLHLNQLMDKAIKNGVIRPVIIVMPDSYTQFGGSFYANSTFTGNWADFIAKDVTSFIDQHYRTIPGKNSRGITGISMGGHGAIKMAMLFPDIFGIVYASTPAILNWSEGVNPVISAFKNISTGNEKEIMGSFAAKLMIDLGRTYSPNENKPPFYADLPATYTGDSMVLNIDAIQKWNANLPTAMIDYHVDALKSIKAFKIDWGRNDAGRHTPVTCLEFSRKLERYGIDHFAEEYLGGHDDKLPGIDGRFYTEVLPFFETYLSLETKAYN
jgi:S-formylglutathione hydrolase FrmB